MCSEFDSRSEIGVFGERKVNSSYGNMFYTEQKGVSPWMRYDHEVGDVI